MHLKYRAPGVVHFSFFLNFVAFVVQYSVVFFGVACLSLLETHIQCAICAHCVIVATSAAAVVVSATAAVGLP